MARMHTRRKGRSGSKRPAQKETPGWVTLSPEEVERMVVELADQGLSTSEIGMVLRDKYGVPLVSMVTGKKITAILREKGKAPKVPEDLYSLIVKAIKMQKHLSSNHKDFHNTRWLHNTESKIRRLAKYYKRVGVLPESWKYSRDTAEMLIS